MRRFYDEAIGWIRQVEAQLGELCATAEGASEPADTARVADLLASIGREASAVAVRAPARSREAPAASPEPDQEPGAGGEPTNELRAKVDHWRERIRKEREARAAEAAEARRVYVDQLRQHVRASFRPTQAGPPEPPTPTAAIDHVGTTVRTHDAVAMHVDWPEPPPFDLGSNTLEAPVTTPVPTTAATPQIAPETAPTLATTAVVSASAADRVTTVADVEPPPPPAEFAADCGANPESPVELPVGPPIGAGPTQATPPSEQPAELAPARTPVPKFRRVDTATAGEANASAAPAVRFRQVEPPQDDAAG